MFKAEKPKITIGQAQNYLQYINLNKPESSRASTVSTYQQSSVRPNSSKTPIKGKNLVKIIGQAINNNFIENVDNEYEYDNQKSLDENMKDYFIFKDT